jgi:hypothetical protein
MLTMRAGVRLFLLSAAPCWVLLAPPAASGQAIRGRLVSVATHQPISGGQVELHDSTGRLMVTAKSTTSGTFVIVAPSRGRFRFRAIAIGYNPIAFTDISISIADTAFGDVEMTRTASRPLPTGDEPNARNTTRLPDLLATTRPILVREYHFYRLWDQVTENYIAVVAYTLHFRGLIPNGDGDARTAPVLLRLHQYRVSALRFSDTTIALDVEVPADRKTLSSCSGFFVVPSAADVTGWTLIATQPRRAGSDGEDSRPPLPTGPLVLSDLVLGAEGHRLEWDNHGDHVFLAGREPIDVRDAIHLFYQARSKVSRSDVHTDVAVYAAEGSGATAAPLLHLSFDGELVQGVNPAQRRLDLSHLNSGTYRVEVQVVDRASGLIARQAVMVDLQ